eukprot:4901450-Prymnesium_polylepis.2
MEAIKEIQETVDLARKDMPTGVATKIMKKCQDVYEKIANLHTIQCVRIWSAEGTHLEKTERAYIVEECSEDTWRHEKGRHNTSFEDVLDAAMMPPSARHWTLPCIIEN